MLYTACTRASVRGCPPQLGLHSPECQRPGFRLFLIANALRLVSIFTSFSLSAAKATETPEHRESADTGARGWPPTTTGLPAHGPQGVDSFLLFLSVLSPVFQNGGLTPFATRRLSRDGGLTSFATGRVFAFSKTLTSPGVRRRHLWTCYPRGCRTFGLYPPTAAEPPHQNAKT